MKTNFRFRPTKNTKSDPKTGRRLSMWTPAKEKKLYDLYVTKKQPMQVCATHFGCSLGAVQQHLYRKGWARRRPGFIKNTEFIIQNEPEFLISRYQSGISAAELAKEFKLSERRLIRFLKESGVFRDTPKDRYDTAAGRRKHWSVQQVYFNMRIYLNVDYQQLHPLEYRKLVHAITGRMFKEWRDHIDPGRTRGRENEMDLDHIFAVSAGTHKLVDGQLVIRRVFVPPEFIAHPANLRMLPRSENVARKMKDGSFDAEALKKRVLAFNKKYGDPYRSFR